MPVPPHNEEKYLINGNEDELKENVLEASSAHEIENVEPLESEKVVAHDTENVESHELNIDNILDKEIITNPEVTNDADGINVEVVNDKKIEEEVTEINFAEEFKKISEKLQELYEPVDEIPDKQSKLEPPSSPDVRSIPEIPEVPSTPSIPDTPITETPAMSEPLTDITVKSNDVVGNKIPMTKPELKPKPNIGQLKKQIEFRKQKHSIISNDIKQEIVIENEKENENDNNENVIMNKTETERIITIIREKPEIKKKPDMSKLNVKPKFTKSMSTNTNTTRNNIISSSTSRASSTIEGKSVSEMYSSYTTTSYTSNGSVHSSSSSSSSSTSSSHQQHHNTNHHHLINNNHQYQELNGFAEKLNKTIDDTPLLINEFRNFNHKFAQLHQNNNLDSQRDENEKSENYKNEKNNNDVFQRRTKYRLNEMSRDVPNYRRLFIDDTFSNMSSVSSSDDGTKDVFYNLLDKINQTKSRASVRRNRSLQESCLSDHWENRASINTFLQYHATTGTAVKQIQAQIEAKHK